MAMRDALEYAADAGVVMVGAAGNDAGQVGLYPAASPLVIGVSASIEPNYQNLYVKSNLSGEFTVVNNLYKQQVRGNENCRCFNFYKEKLKIKLLKRYRMQRETFTTVHWVKRLCLLARKPGDFFMESATIPQKSPALCGALVIKGISFFI